MNNLWNITIDDYFEVIELARKNGKKPGDSMEEEFLELMNKKNKKPFGATELTKDEYISEQLSHGKNILSVDTKEDGTTQIKGYNSDKE